MVYIFSYLCNILFPPAASVAQVADENPTSFLRFFTPQRFQTYIALSQYSQPHIQAAITANKFHHDTHSAELLAGLLKHWCNTLPPSAYILVPVPLSAGRLRERGHNQVTTVAKHALAPHPSITIRENILTRSRHTKQQSHLSRAERLINIKEAFVCKHDPSLDRVAIILLDDVITTGSTLKAAKTALQAGFPQSVIICVALAH